MGLLDEAKGRLQKWLLTVALKKGATQAVSKLAALLVAAKVAELSDGKLVLDLDAASAALIAGLVFLIELARNRLKHR